MKFNQRNHQTSITHRSTWRSAVFMASAVLACAALCHSSANSGQIFPRDQMLLPYLPAAMTEGPEALHFNPAALGSQPGFAINYYRSYRDSEYPPDLNGDDALYLSKDGVAFSVDWLGSGDPLDSRVYTIGLSSGDHGALQFGTSYQWRSSDDPVQNKSHFWTHGLLWQPSDWLSLAAVAHNYNRMKVNGVKSDAEFVYSAAVQTLDDRLRVGGDWYQNTSQRVKDGTYRLAASYEVSDGLTVFGDFNEDSDYFLGVRFNLSQIIVGTHASFHHKSGHNGGVAYAGLHEAHRNPIVRVRREVVQLNVSGEIPDRRPARQLFATEPPTTLDLLTLLDRAANDGDVRTVVVKLDDPRLGWARMEELRRALLRVRENGKNTVVYCPDVIGNGEYYLASAADLIVVPPVSSVELLGLRAEVSFARRLLDKLGINADLEHIGEYKTASDLLTRTSMSDAHRESINRLLDDFDEQLVSAIAQGRDMAEEDIRAWIDHGPFVSVDALDAGMVDRVAYPDELRDIVNETFGWSSNWIDGDELAKRVYATREWGDPTRVAVVVAEGTIRGGSDRSDFGGAVMGAETISKSVDRASRDGRIGAIVLRVNSGGGEIFASDAIWRSVQRARESKPVIVSFGDVAASGGYYIAAAADSIFALPNTVTGSIGVIHGKLDFSGLYDKIGIDREAVTRGPYANMNTSSAPYNEDERDVVRDQMARAYERFVDLVADGRGLSADSVDAIGRGRVWSGSQAVKLGLVDRFADLHEAIQVAAHMAGVTSGHTVALDVWPKPSWQILPFNGFGPLALDASLGSVARGLSQLTGLGPESETSYELPFVLTVK